MFELGLEINLRTTIVSAIGSRCGIWHRGDTRQLGFLLRDRFGGQLPLPITTGYLIPGDAIPGDASAESGINVLTLSPSVVLH